MKKNMPRFGVCARGIVGEMAIRFFRNNREQLQFIFISDDDFWGWNDKILHEAEICNLDKSKIYVYSNEKQFNDIIKQANCDCIILAYWEKIIKKSTLDLISWGCINLHTSFLPYGKGKHPHCWAIINEETYGTTIMKIDEGLDTGEILYQKEIEVTWEDTAQTLYFKAIKETWKLLYKNKKSILSLQMNESAQICDGTFHYGKELNRVAKIDINRTYRARDIFNILRAKSFDGFPSAWFEDDGIEYEVKIEIKKKENNVKPDYVGLSKSMNVWPIDVIE